MKQRGNNVVCDYDALAVWAFKRHAGNAYRVLMDRGLGLDWWQEIRAAAWQAGQEQLGSKDALHFFGRACYHALRSMGFARGPWKGFALRA